LFSFTLVLFHPCSLSPLFSFTLVLFHPCSLSPLFSFTLVLFGTGTSSLKELCCGFRFTKKELNTNVVKKFQHVMAKEGVSKY
jgi:hypothetical protein